MTITACVGNLPADWRKAVDKLRQGWDSATKLKLLISENSSSGGFADDLILEILDSFSYALSVLDNGDQVCPWTESCGHRKDDSEGSSKSFSRVKARRGCYNRRKTEAATSRETPSMNDDGHAWRKYGQKPILNCKYHRSYFRCTYKSEGCNAMKQVQQIKDDPPMYRSTYYGHHTCQKHNLLKSSKLMTLDGGDHDDGDCPMLLDFDKSNNTTWFQYDPLVPSPDRLNAIFEPSSLLDHMNLSSRYLMDDFDDDVLQQCQHDFSY